MGFTLLQVHLRTPSKDVLPFECKCRVWPPEQSQEYLKPADQRRPTLAWRLLLFLPMCTKLGRQRCGKDTACPSKRWEGIELNSDKEHILGRKIKYGAGNVGKICCQNWLAWKMESLEFCSEALDVFRWVLRSPWQFLNKEVGQPKC